MIITKILNFARFNVLAPTNSLKTGYVTDMHKLILALIVLFLASVPRGINRAFSFAVYLL